MNANSNSFWIKKVVSGGPVARNSSVVGWPFWIPVFLTAIPFAALFGIWVIQITHEPLSWWLWMLAVPIGLMPAMILGLIVQTAWSIRIAVRENRFDWFDALFAAFLLLLCAGLGLLYWRSEQWFEVVMRVYVLLIIFPMVRLYVQRRERGRKMGI
jgi:hypothetical protein